MTDNPDIDHTPNPVREARDGVRSLQFFVAAMSAQLHDLHDKLDPAAMPEMAPDQRVAQLEMERDSARRESERLQARISDLERQVDVLRTDLERNRVAFADHHAIKQEAARLRAELETVRSGRGPEEASSGRRRWSLG